MNLHALVLLAAPYGVGDYSVGAINAAQSTPITHVFSVANATEKTVTIDRLQSSCACLDISAGMP